jgi:hypothetical protein
MSSGYTASYVEVKGDGSIKQVVATDPSSRNRIEADLNSGRYREYARLESGGQLKEIYVQDRESGAVYKIDVSSTSQISRSYSSSSNSYSSSSSSSSSPGSSSSSPSSYQYSFSSRELQGNKEFWNIYNNYAIKAVDEKIKNDPEFRKALAESGDYAFARSQAILLTAINKYKTGEDGVILAPKERRGSYLSDAEITGIINKEKENNLNSLSNNSIKSDSLGQESSSAFSKVRKIADSALAARYVFSQIANPTASNADGSVTYLIGDQTVKVKDVKTQYVGMEDGKYVYKQTLKAGEDKQYIVEARLDSNLEKAEYTIKENRLLTNTFDLRLQGLNYTPYNPMVDNYEKRSSSPPEQFEKAAKEGFKKIGISNVPIVGDVFNFGTEVFSRGVLGSAYELVNPSGAVGEKAKSIGQSGLGFAASLPFRAGAGIANLVAVYPLEFFKESSKGGGEKISRGDYLGGAVDIGLGAAVAGLTVVPLFRGAASSLKGAGSNLAKKEIIKNTAEAKAIERLERKIYGDDYIYIKGGSIEGDILKNKAIKEANTEKGGVFGKIDVPGSVALSVITDPMAAGAAFNAVKGMIPAFVPAVAVKASVTSSVKKSAASSFIDDAAINTVSVPKYRYFSPGMFSEKESYPENNFFVTKPYMGQGLTIEGSKNMGMLVIKEKKVINELPITENKNTLIIKDGFGKDQIDIWPYKINDKTKNKNKNENKNDNEYPLIIRDGNILVRKEKNKNKAKDEDSRFEKIYKEKSIFGTKYKEGDVFGFKEKYGNKEEYKNKTKNQYENEYMYGYKEQYKAGAKTKSKSDLGKIKIPIPSLPNFNFFDRRGRKKSIALGFSKLELKI